MAFTAQPDHLKGFAVVRMVGFALLAPALLARQLLDLAAALGYTKRGPRSLLGAIVSGLSLPPVPHVGVVAQTTPPLTRASLFHKAFRALTSVNHETDHTTPMKACNPPGSCLGQYTEYAGDEERNGIPGLRVRCTACGHIIWFPEKASDRDNTADWPPPEAPGAS